SRNGRWQQYDNRTGLLSISHEPAQPCRKFFGLGLAVFHIIDAEIQHDDGRLVGLQNLGERRLLSPWRFAFDDRIDPSAVEAMAKHLHAELVRRVALGDRLFNRLDEP